MSGQDLYLNFGDSVLWYEASNPYQPLLLGRYQAVDWVSGWRVAGDVAYAVDAGLRVLRLGR